MGGSMTHVAALLCSDAVDVSVLRAAAPNTCFANVEIAKKRIPPLDREEIDELPLVPK